MFVQCRVRRESPIWSKGSKGDTFFNRVLLERAYKRGVVWEFLGANPTPTMPLYCQCPCSYHHKIVSQKIDQAGQARNGMMIESYDCVI